MLQLVAALYAALLPVGTIICVTAEAKTSAPRVGGVELFTLTVVNFVQLPKALLFIEVTVFGIVILVNAEQPLNT